MSAPAGGLRVLALAGDYPPRVSSGIGSALAAQALALAREGVGVTVLVASDLRPAWRPPAGDAPRVLALDRRRFPVDPGGFDWLHLHALRLAPLALELKRRHGLRLATTVHGFPHLELGAWSAWSDVQRHVLRASDRVVFVSAEERRLGLALDPSLRDRARCVPDGLEDSAVALRPARGFARPSGPIVFAGRFTWVKGIDVVEHVAAALLPRHPAGLVLAGGRADAVGGGVVARLRARFGTAVQAPGWLERDALVALFDRAALVLAPSRYEPFGLVALEALARGAPLLASDVGGLRDVAGDGAGWLLPAGDATAWVAAARRVLDDHTLRAALAARGPARVAARFTSAHAARALLREVYTPSPK
jgi:glycosyltransferase involved in cell wall biosynthesis